MSEDLGFKNNLTAFYDSYFVTLVFFVCVCVCMLISGCCSNICGKALFAQVHCLCSCVKEQLTPCSLYSVPLIYFCILPPIPHCLDYCSFMVSLGSCVVSVLQLCSFPSIELAIPDHFGKK